MAKWYGHIGYAETKEKTPGVWIADIIERNYYGDIIRDSRNYQTTNQVNTDINIANKISIVADPYANLNIDAMRYVTLNGIKWAIKDVEVQYPRLILNLGGVYKCQGE